MGTKIEEPVNHVNGQPRYQEEGIRWKKRKKFKTVLGNGEKEGKREREAHWKKKK